MIIEGLQYGFGELYWPRGVRNDFFFIFLKTSNKPKKFNFDKTFCSG